MIRMISLLILIVLGMGAVYFNHSGLGGIFTILTAIYFVGYILLFIKGVVIIVKDAEYEYVYEKHKKEKPPSKYKTNIECFLVFTLILVSAYTEWYVLASLWCISLLFILGYDSSMREIHNTARRQLETKVYNEKSTSTRNITEH